MTILALHGFTGCGADFTPLEAQLGGHWICPNLPGHGPNPEMDCSPQRTIDLIDALYNEISSEDTRILLGYSMGARAALLHATEFPEKWDKLILIGSNPGIEDEAKRAARRTADQELSDSILKDGIPVFLDRWQETPLIKSQKSIRFEWLETMRSNRLQHQPEGLSNNLQMFGQGSVPNLWTRLDRLTMPVCLITGALDSKYTGIAKRFITALSNPHSTHCIIEDAGHMPHLERPEPTNRLIENFLSDD